MIGTVYLVGAGPGPADLLTIRAARLLSEADVVLHDALVQPEVIALAVRARIMSVGKRAGRPSMDQRMIGRLLVRLSRRHATVVRLKGGDPHLFGRASEEIAACREAGVPVVTAPGVTAAFGAAAALGLSLSERGVSRSVTFVTPAVGRGEVASDHWARAAAAAETAVIYMGARRAQTVREALLRSGLPATRPVALVESALCPGERVVCGTLADLAELAQALGAGPTLLVIGEVARHAGTAVAVARAA